MLYIDAEQSFLQGAIESFGQQLTHTYNQGERVTIMNGFQNYLTRMKHVIPMEVHASRVFNFNLGVKLIRGAYMNEERELAASQGSTSPVWASIEQTHECYDTNLAHVISHMTPADQILVASHNQHSVEVAKTAMAENYRLRHAQERVSFGQLMGFSDNVTGGLRNEGYKVFKYVPFGPTEQVMPYLVRRG